MGTHWSDLDCQGRKLTRLIRYMETRMKHCKSDEKIIRYANTIGLLISKHTDLVKFRYSVNDMLKEFKVRKTPYEKGKKFEK